ncbi:MAG TPA: ABC transporter ATP-binding protein [Mycobacteriales bacterium]|nr:ABC transporter ATP-binding protein [Mycobacteriales bacterium]
MHLQVPPGAVVAVLGPNGRGKTTLLRCAAGLLRPQRGTVRRQGPVGYVPQARPGTFGYRVIEMVLMGRARHVPVYGTPGPADREAAHAALARVGLSALSGHPYLQLSGGEQQLVLLARALASGADTLVLDEPVSALDPRNQGRILRLLRLLAGSGIGILLTTHQPDHALLIADRATLMIGPGDVRTGDAAAMLTDTLLGSLYGIPMRTVCYQDGGVDRRVLVPRYEPEPSNPARLEDGGRPTGAESIARSSAPMCGSESVTDAARRRYLATIVGAEDERRDENERETRRENQDGEQRGPLRGHAPDSFPE